MQMNIIVMYRWAFLSFLHVQRHLYSVKVQLYPLLGTGDCSKRLFFVFKQIWIKKFKQTQSQLIQK